MFGRKKQGPVPRRKNKLREWLEAITYALLVLLFLYLFIARTVIVQSTSMHGTLLPGDVVIINKLSYGARTPITLFDNPFNDDPSGGFTLPFGRIPGFADIEHNELLCFNYPYQTDVAIDKRTILIKRVVGLPGDTLTIERDSIIVSGKVLPEPLTLAYDHQVKFNTDTLEPIFTALDILEGGPISNMNDWVIPLTKAQADSLRNRPEVGYIKKWHQKLSPSDEFIFPYSPAFPWTADHYGPIYIPAKGDSIVLTTGNYPFFERIIRDSEHNDLELTDEGFFFINGQRDSLYVLRQDYFFVVGDNRLNSSDSRFWGFVPADHIIGKAEMVLFSMNKKAADLGNKIRWNRLFKSVDE